MEIELLNKKEYLNNFLFVVSENVYIDISDVNIRWAIISAAKNAACDVNYKSFIISTVYDFENLYIYVDCSNCTPLISLTDTVSDNYKVIKYYDLNLHSRKYKIKKLLKNKK